MLNWSQQFSIFSFLDSSGYNCNPGNFECLLATGSVASVKGDSGDLLTQVQKLHNERRDWLFGHISYDFKNQLEPGLATGHPLQHTFPQLHFFVPETVCHIDAAQTLLTIASFAEPDEIFNWLTSASPISGHIPEATFDLSEPEAAYLETIGQLRRHIRNGDCYEINYCVNGQASVPGLDPYAVFTELSELSPAPFSALYRADNAWLICASPERYLHKKGQMLTAQPIKGTARRGTTVAEDEANKARLRSSIKEQAENVMIVDLMRNDLARTCRPGSIKVNELFGIYTYPQVHQMISTISGEMKEEIPFTDAIRHSFPMGSMTGAPKYKVMQLIDRYEKTARELFSGTTGYVTPAGDFDFNVVIRSLFYNSSSGHLSYEAGGAITYESNAAEEWLEMRTKAWAMERIFKKS